MRHNAIPKAVTALVKDTPRILIVAIIIWTVLFTAIGAWKYATFQYRDLDLAYFTQVFWNTSHGRPFGLTIHPHLSLGDHAEWLILPLSLIFAVAPHSLTLILLQAFALSLPAVPLHRFARRRLPARAALGVALAYLLLAVPANAALFEFHPLIFALPLLLAAADAYDRRDFRLFVIWLMLALAVREDVAGAVLGFAALALLERRERKWLLTPAALALAVALFDLAVIKNFSIGGNYKFSLYYSWLGGELARWPRLFFQRLSALPPWEFLVALFLPFLILPLVRPRWLALSALPILGIILTAPGGGVLALKMHYATLALPGMLLAATDGLNTLFFWRSRLLPWAPLQKNDRVVLAIILALALTVDLWTVGPLAGIFRYAFRDRDPAATATSELVRQIPATASVAASDTLLPALARRQKIYAIKYIFLGETQYGAAAYTIGETPDYLALDARDALRNAVSFPTLAWTRDANRDGAARIKKILSAGRYGAVWQAGPFTLWQKGAGSGENTDVTPAATAATEHATAVGNAKVYGLRKKSDCATKELCLTMTVALQTDPGENLLVSLAIQNTAGATLERETRVLGDGLFPAPEWRIGKPYALTLRLLGVDAAAAKGARVTFFRPRGTLLLGPLGSSQLLILKPPAQGTVIPIEN